MTSQAKFRDLFGSKTRDKRPGKQVELEAIVELEEKPAAKKKAATKKKAKK